MISFLREHVRKTLHIHPDAYTHQSSSGRWPSFVYALAGCLHMLRYAKNIRIQLMAALVVVIWGTWLGLAALEWAILVLVIGVNMLAEFFNAALEAAVNLAAPEYHPMAHLAKDIGAGGALLAAFMATIIAGLILAPATWEHLT